MAPGGSGRTLRDRDPYTGDTLAEIAMADNSDLNESYESAHRAQRQWATMLPAERAAIMLRAAAIIELRHEEILDWLIRESGSTRIKAQVEWQFLHGITLEAASFPHRMA